MQKLFELINGIMEAQHFLQMLSSSNMKRPSINRIRFYREEAELKKDRSDMCIDVSFQRAALCKTLKKAHLSGAKVDDFTHSHDFTCTDIVLG